METKTENKHSPTPWHIEPKQWDHGATIAIMAADNLMAAEISPLNPEDEPDMLTAERDPADQANAEFIVRAVNSHEVLLEAAKEAYRAILQGESQFTPIARKALEKAIAQAESKQ